MIAKPTYQSVLNGYVQIVDSDDACTALRANTEQWLNVLQALTPMQWEYRYAPEKWSIKEIVQHISDTERIFGYRMLRFLRKDATPLPGYDENHFAAAGRANDYSGQELMDEFMAIRQSSTWLFEHCKQEDLDFVGQANGNDMTPRAIAFAIVGHAVHHMQILHERYGIS